MPGTLVSWHDKKKQVQMSEGKRRGFTLVEVIVVSVIVLVLSAVAIPLYSGYVRDAQQGTVDNLAQTAAAAANAYWRKTGDVFATDVELKEKIRIFYDEDKFSITLDGANSVRAAMALKPEIYKSVRYKDGN